MRLSLLFLVLCSGSLQPPLATAAEGNNRDFHFLTVNKRSPEDLVPLLTRLFGNRATFAASGLNLVVETDEKTLAEVRKLLRELDQSVAQFRIEVTLKSKEEIEQLNRSIGGRIRTKGMDVRVGNSEAKRNGGSATVSNGTVTVTGSAENQSQSSGTNSALSVVVMEGSTGSIQLGSGTTLVVSARKAGKQKATLEVRTRAEDGKRSGGIQSTRMVGYEEWVELGGSKQTSVANTSQIGSSEKSNAESDARYWIRVVPID